jgi:hypothetical protein
MFMEMKGKMDGSPGASEVLAGFKHKFMEGNITGYMTSNMKTFATYSKSMEGGNLKMDFNT